MEKLPCSIFNDVIGPVMRGPSSSHVAGGARIAEIVRQSAQAPLKKVICDFDPTGALAASHTGHGTDMGFACGLLGIDLSAPNVDQYETLARERGLEIRYRILKYGAVHPGNYRIQAIAEDGSKNEWEGISVGGGIIEMQRFNGFQVTIHGDFYELLITVESGEADVGRWQTKLAEMLPPNEFCLRSYQENSFLIEWKMAVPVDRETLQRLKAEEGVLQCVYLEPILPIYSRRNCDVPYQNAKALLAYAEEHPMEAWRYAALYESMRGGISQEEVLDKMDKLLAIMEQAVDSGLAGTSYKDRILGPQAYKIDQAAEKGCFVPCAPLNSVIKCITAVMEVKSSMGLIVAAPTVGSCGCLPGTVIGLGRELGLSRDAMVKGLMMAGLVGVFIAEAATFSAEVAGCQVECGAASGMAAAALAQMMGGTVKQCIDAASMALQNVTGLACDPVANRVEVPCLGKNVMGGTNAIASANMVLAGYDAVIPLDETISAIYEIGLSLPLELRCTFGGLGKTKTAMDMLNAQGREA